jgi:hypothetical protein
MIKRSNFRPSKLGVNQEIKSFAKLITSFIFDDMKSFLIKYCIIVQEIEKALRALGG